MTDERAVPELFRPMPADSVGAQRQTRQIEADKAERESLARRFDLLALDRLEASLELHRDKADIVRIHGRLVADVVQSCIVSLAPVPAHLEVEFDASYSSSAAELIEAELDPLGEDPPEPIVDGVIDLGEVVAQELAVALDPYPRAPGTTLPPADAGGAPRRTPFAALAGLKLKP